MKKIILLAGLLFALSFFAEAQTDTVRDEKAARKERREDRRERGKNEREHIKDELKDAAGDVAREATDIYDEAKRSVKDAAESLKENFRQVKESVSSWFNENITANTVGEFAEIRRQDNQDFSDYLRSAWQEYPLGIGAGRSPLLEGAFHTSKIRGNEAGKETSGPLVVQVEEVIEPLESISAPVPENYYRGAGDEAVSNMVSKQQFVTFKFYGKEIKVYYNPALRNIKIGKGIEKGVSKFWQYLSSQEFDPVLLQLYQYKDELLLNDYQYYLLVRRFSDLLFNKGKNGENLLFAVFLLNQTGYDARIGQFQGEGGSRLAVLLPFFEEVSGRAHVSLGNNRYYLMDVEPGKKIAQCKVRVYEKAHANARHPFSIRMEPQSTGFAPLYGKFQGYTFDERLAQMQSDMPAGPLPLYADARFSQLMNKTFLYKLLPELDSVVGKKQDANLKERLSEREKQEIKVLSLNALLNRALSSQSKQSAKMTARCLYPETMFWKKGSGDILDRSMLLCQICNHILGIPAVLLVYPDFAMAAVGFCDGETAPGSPFFNGDYVEWDGKRYLLCGKLPKAVKNPGKAKLYKW